MDNSGNIKRFVNEEQAEKNGFKELLTDSEAYFLENVSEERRLDELGRLKIKAERVRQKMLRKGMR